MGLQMIQTGDRIGLDVFITRSGCEKKEAVSEESIGFLPLDLV